MAEALNVKWEAKKDDIAFQRNSITESLVRINSTQQYETSFTEN